MKAHVDQDTCIGCGLCPQICSEVFDLKDDGKAHAIKEDVPSDMENAAVEAQESCPVAAITVD
ncbi:MAG: ferredoxin [Clostridium perfringens]|nr:ferredoxin [Clostridium perfringens]